MDAAQQTTLAQDRLNAIADAAKRDDPDAALPIALALAAQVLGAIFSIAASLAKIAATNARAHGE